MTLPKKSRPSTRKFSLPKSNEIREKIDLSDLEQKVYTFMAQTKLYKKYKPRIKGLSAAEL